MPTSDWFTQRVRDTVWLAAVTAIAGLFVFRLIVFGSVLETGALTSDGLATMEVGSGSPNRSIGKDYFPELGKSFLRGHLYLDREISPALADHPNPYGVDAARRGIILQDGSYFQGKYYLYFGPAPVLFLYLPFHFIVGAFPSDALVATLLGCCYALIVALLLNFVLGPRRWAFLPAYCLLVANPLVLKSIISMQQVHGVSRMFAATCILTSTYFLLKLQREMQGSLQRTSAQPGEYSTALAASFFACLAIATRISAIPDLVGLSVLFGAAVCIGRPSLGRREARLLAIFAAPVLATGISLALYNVARFGNPFDFGQRYQTMGYDFVHGAPVIRIPQDPMLFVFNLGYRLFEYFLVLPNFDTPTSVHLTYGTRSPFIAEAYSEGAAGMFTWAPIVLLIPYAIWRAIRQRELVVRRRFALIWLGVALFQFATNFMLVSGMPIMAFHYSLEIAPRLALLVVALLNLDSSLFEATREAPLRTVALVLTVVFSVSGMLAEHLFST